MITKEVALMCLLGVVACKDQVVARSDDVLLPASGRVEVRGPERIAPATAAQKASPGPTKDPVLETIDSCPDYLIQKNNKFGLAVRGFLDDSRWSNEEKFEFLAKQSERSEERGAGLAGFLAELDWPRFVTYVSRRKKPLGSEEWHSVCLALYDRKEWVRANRANHRISEKFEYPPVHIRQLFDRARHEPNQEARWCMIAALDRSGVTVQQALELAAMLATEIDPLI